MTAKTKHWLTDPSGTRALVEGKEERDRWVGGHGWADSTEPATGDQVQVWMQHAKHGGRAKFPASVVETWKGLDWEPSAPPEPVDVLHDQHLVDEAAAPAGPDAEPAVKAAPKNAPSADSGNSKEK